MRIIASFLAFATLACADERNLKIVNAPSNQGLQEIVTLLRTVDDIPKVTVDSDRHGFTVEAAPAYLDAAEWLVHQMDQAAGWQPSEQEMLNPSAREYRLPPSERAPVIRVYYLPETVSNRDMQETLTVLRTVLDVQKIFNYSSLHMLAYRGTVTELDAVEWLLHALDNREVSQPYALPEAKPADLLRVFPLPPDTTVKQTQQMLTQLRMPPVSIMKVFNRSNPPAFAVRGTAAQLDQAATLISTMKP